MKARFTLSHFMTFAFLGGTLFTFTRLLLTSSTGLYA